MSSLKEYMESTLRPSNHLIATGSRLDGNTLHIKASSLDGHSLIKVVHMLYRVHSTIVDGEHLLMGLPRKYCRFNLTCEGRLGNLVQRFAHSVISQASARWALVSTFVMVFFVVGKSLAW